MARNGRSSRYQQLYASHEIRMWLTQIVIPAGAIVAFCPELREWMKDTAVNTGHKIKEKAKIMASKIRRK